MRSTTFAAGLPSAASDTSNLGLLAISFSTARRYTFGGRRDPIPPSSADQRHGHCRTSAGFAASSLTASLRVVAQPLGVAHHLERRDARTRQQRAEQRAGAQVEAPMPTLPVSPSAARSTPYAFAPPFVGVRNTASRTAAGRARRPRRTAGSRTLRSPLADFLLHLIGAPRSRRRRSGPSRSRSRARSQAGTSRFSVLQNFLYRIGAMSRGAAGGKAHPLRRLRARRAADGDGDETEGEVAGPDRAPCAAPLPDPCHAKRAVPLSSCVLRPCSFYRRADPSGRDTGIASCDDRSSAARRATPYSTERGRGRMEPAHRGHLVLEDAREQRVRLTSPARSAPARHGSARRRPRRRQPLHGSRRASRRRTPMGRPRRAGPQVWNFSGSDAWHLPAERDDARTEQLAVHHLSRSRTTASPRRRTHGSGDGVPECEHLAARRSRRRGTRRGSTAPSRARSRTRPVAHVVDLHRAPAAPLRCRWRARPRRSPAAAPRTARRRSGRDGEAFSTWRAARTARDLGHRRPHRRRRPPARDRKRSRMSRRTYTPSRPCLWRMSSREPGPKARQSRDVQLGVLQADQVGTREKLA